MSSSPRVALITGCARRIGASIARHLHAHGWNLVLHAHHSASELQALAEQLQQQRSNSVLTLLGDLRDPALPAQLVERSVAHFGRLDGLINNASNFHPTPLASATPEQWQDLFGVNAQAPFFLAQAAAPILREHAGAIVNLSDLHASRPLRDHPLYCAAKAALEMLTRSLALELAPQVRVNAIAPGAILWPDQGKSEAAKQALLARTPLARTGDPEEIAAAVRWLLEEASFLTGHILPLDGGRRLS